MLDFLALLYDKFHGNEPWGYPRLSCLLTSSFSLFYPRSGPLILKEILFDLFRDVGLVVYSFTSVTDRQTKIGSVLFKSAVIHPEK